MATQHPATDPGSTPARSADRGRIWRAGLISILGAIIANLILRAIFFALLDLPADFPPLQPGSIIVFTAIFTAVGVLVYALVSRWSKNPARTFAIIAAVALVLSILPNLGLMANPAGAPFPGGSALAFGVLIIFHFSSALVFTGLLLYLTRAPAR